MIPNNHSEQTHANGQIKAEWEAFCYFLNCYTFNQAPLKISHEHFLSLARRTTLTSQPVQGGTRQQLLGPQHSLLFELTLMKKDSYLSLAPSLLSLALTHRISASVQPSHPPAKFQVSASISWRDWISSAPLWSYYFF